MNGDERADLQKRVWDLEKANRELQDRLAAQRDPGDLDGLLAAATAGEASTATRDRDGRGGRGGDSRGRSSSGGLQQAIAIRELMSKPEVQAMVSLQHKAAIEARYAPLFKNLNLPADQIEKLKSLLADRSTTMQDVMIAAREQGLNPRENPEAFKKVIADAQNQINDGIKSVIGDQGLAQLSNYEQTLPQRNVVNELQQRLSYTSTPLTAAQAEQMVQILANNTPPPQPGSPGAAGGNTRIASAPMGRGGPPAGGVVRINTDGMGNSGIIGGPGLGTMMGTFDGGARGTAPVTSAAVAQAQTVLAPPQVTALQQIQQQQQTQQQLKQLVNDTLTSNRPTTSGSNSGKTSGGSNSSGSSGGQRRRGGGG